MLKGRRIILGVTGSIAAYKAAELARKLIQEGADVITVMTEGAQQFIAPLTFRTITRNPVATSLFADPASPVPHISLAQWADLIVIAPATADTIARVAQGRANDLMTALILDTTAPILWAPAMNTRMWENPITQGNIAKLSKQGQQWIQPDAGELACLETGKGRLATIEAIHQKIVQILIPTGPLVGKTVLITAGPTREPWDGIRYLSNRSSGKMGYAFAAELQRRGACVTLISGPVSLETPIGVDRIDVETAQEMHSIAMEKFSQSDIVVATAAVADFRPAQVQTGKLKKTLNPETIPLESTLDILKEMGSKKKQQRLIGFAAESENIEAAAIAKRQAKNCDLMIANQATGPEDTFASETAKVFCVHADNHIDVLPRQSKTEVAHQICDRIEKLISKS